MEIIGKVRRPGKTWLENMEVHMAELEIDREDINDEEMKMECYEPTAKNYKRSCVPSF